MPNQEIDQAFLQLTYAIKLLTYVERGLITKADLDGEVQINLESGNLVVPANSFNSNDDIILATQNNYVLTLGFSAITLNTAFESANIPAILPMSSPHRDLRMLVYMVRCAFAHNMMRPRWVVRGDFARRLSVTLRSGVLNVDCSTLDGVDFQDTHIGGIEKYFQLKDEVKNMLAALHP